MRIGNGYDVHKLVEGRPLVIGGITIPFEKGLLGHSDADVLIHAIMDSLLGAAGLEDIGVLFPDTSNEFINIDSKKLLSKTVKIIKEKGFVINNIDSIIVAEKPKLVSLIPEMKKTIAKCCSIDINCVNIKATTEESLGFTGRGEGIAAYAVCLLI